MNYHELSNSFKFSAILVEETGGRINNVDLLRKASKTIVNLLVRAEKAEKERDVEIKMLRKIEWCNGCKNFRGLQGCRIDALVTCNPQNDMYVFGEWEE